MSRWQVPKHFKVRIGGNTYIDCGTLIEYKGQALFDLKRSDSDGYLAINFDLFDEYCARLATVRNGNFVGKTPPGYEIAAERDHYSLVDTTTGRAVCDIRLRDMAEGDLQIDVSAQMFAPDGKLLEFTPTQTNVETLTVQGQVISNCRVGIGIA